MSALLLLLIRIYQRVLSPLLGDCCRFEPSCSRYAASCIAHHGAARGSWLSFKRVLRCNPFCQGGIDLPPVPGAAEPDWQRIARLSALPGERPPLQRPLASELGTHGHTSRS